MMLMLFTGQRVFGAIGAVAAIAALALWGTGGQDIPFAAAMKLMKWYPLLTLPMFIFMGYVLSESRLADDLYRMFHVWFGPVNGGLAIGTIGLMVLISAMNGLSVAGMAIGATIALPELLKRGYDKRMVTGVIQAGIVAGHPGAAVGRAGALRDDRPPTGRAALAGRRHPGADDGGDVRRLHLAALPPAAGAGPRPGRRPHDVPASREDCVCCARASCRLADFRRDDGAVRQWLDLAGRKLGDRRDDRAGGRDPETAA